MVSERIVKRVVKNLKAFYDKKGVVENGNLTEFVSHDAVAALAMARYLTKSGKFDRYLAVAPEALSYSYFLEAIGVTTLTVKLNTDDNTCHSDDDLSVINNSRTIIIVGRLVAIEGLKAVLAELNRHNPASLSLYLANEKESAKVQELADRFENIYVAQEIVEEKNLDRAVTDFIELFDITVGF